MARLIDADKRIAEIKKQYCTDCENYGGAKCRACWVDDAICLIEDATTADAVEVVRCKDCMHWDNDFLLCDRKNVRMGEDDFCSYGERKESEKG